MKKSLKLHEVEIIMASPTVSIIQDEKPQICVQKTIALLGGIQQFVHPDEKILLKPNLVVPLKTDTGVTTNPEIISALIQLCYDAEAAKVYVGDSPFFPFKSRQTFEISGMKEAVDDAGGECIYFDEGTYIELASDKTLLLPKARVPKIFESLDGFITVPRLKTHNQTIVSLSLKNQHGLVPPEDKRNFHRDDIHQKLIDLNHIIRNKLRLALIDGTFALEGQGPTLGTPLQLNLCLASSDPVAVDSVATTLMGFLPREITHIKLAALQGLGEMDLTKINFIGIPLENVSRQFLRPSTDIIGIAPNVHVYAGGACRPGCFAWTRVGLDRLIKRNEINKYGELTFIIGHNANVPENLVGSVFVIGDCAAEHREKGTFFEGCPPFEVWDLRDTLKKAKKS
ncbi:MAG: DUF362 domain-containing protein [Promethearchaeota archaeon]|nr:MAG: DUF362 domain-containing protein [Candidatus Lokiarchaeota archaeon]